MKTLVITKKTKDLRPNRTKVFEPGKKITVLDKLADEYIKAGVAEEEQPIISNLSNPATGEEVEDYYDKKAEMEEKKKESK